jgi:hypothetical protein
MSLLSNETLDFDLLDFDKDLWTDFSELVLIDWPTSVDVSYVKWRLESGIIGEAYDCSFDLPDWLNPTGFTVVSGALPDGLTLSPLSDNTCRIYGTPTTAGYFKFTIRASCSDGYGDRECAIHILNAIGGSSESSGICLVI